MSNPNAVWCTKFITIFFVITSPLSIAEVQTINNFEKQWSRAQAGNRLAQYRVGLTYLNGGDVQRNTKKAIFWLGQSAKKGHVKSMHRLALIYYTTQYGLRDYGKASKIFKRAANKGLGVSHYYLARLYLEGKGVQQDLELALICAVRAEASYVHKANQLIQKIYKKRIQRIALLKLGAQKKNNSVKSKTLIEITNKEKLRKLLFIDSVDARKHILNRKWSTNGVPAQHMPSNVNSCKVDAGSIKCSSDKFKVKNENYKGAYIVSTTITDFHAKGTFNVEYRLKYLYISPSSKDDLEDEDAIPTEGWQKYVNKLRCYATAFNSIKCHSDSLVLEKYSSK